MALIEILTLKLGPAMAKAVLRLWLPHNPAQVAVGDSVLDILKAKGESFVTSDSADRLLRNLSSDVAQRLDKLIDVEFPDLPPHEREAAVLAVAEVLTRLDLTKEMLAADLSAVGLERVAQAESVTAFRDLAGGAQRLAEIVLRECCAYAVAIAGKLPNFNVASTRELLTRTSELLVELHRVLDVVGQIRQERLGDADESTFETRYRRALIQRLDRMQMFGVRLVGAGAREPEVSIAYVTLTSTPEGKAISGDVDASLAGLTKVALRGEAGSGKTTLLKWLAIRAARKDFVGDLAPWNRLVPLYVSLREYTNVEFPPPERLVSTVASNLFALMPSGWTHRVLEHRGLVLIDGIDELPSIRRPQLFEWLEALVRDFPKAVFVLSSRPAALDGRMPSGLSAERHLAAFGFERVTLEPMSLADSELLVAQWHRAVGQDLADPNDLEKLKVYEHKLVSALRSRSPIRNLASNPLLCSMMCVLNWDRQQNLPDNRMELYSLALDMLIDIRDAERQIQSAYLGNLDKATKEALLDGLAYWMMRNDITEANRSDIEAQVRLLLQRMSKAPQVANQVLQELLERSGILRQPQVGIVDFLHRTFLEFMAARSAVAAGDLGFLVLKAGEDSWRETVVFAAGHARGKQRDDLIRGLLDAQKKRWRKRPIELDVAAICCLETAESNLDPILLGRLRAVANVLLPPTSVDAARILAPAAKVNSGALKGYTNEQTAAACIRCASLIGGDEMLEVIESYVGVIGNLVDDELVLAWPAFNQEDYFQRVILKHREVIAAGTTNGSVRSSEAKLDQEDVKRCQMFLALRGLQATEVVADAIQKFLETRTIEVPTIVFEGLPGSRRRRTAVQRAARITEPDAESLAAIKSLRGLRLPSCEAGALSMLATLPMLETLVCSPVELDEIGTLSRSPSLMDLTIDGLSVPFKRGTRVNVDLRQFAIHSRLKKLHVRLFDSTHPVLLPKGSSIEELTLISVTLADTKDLSEMTSLSKLYLNLDDDSANELDLSLLTNLTSLVLVSERSIKMKLPRSLVGIAVSNPQSIELLNPGELEHLRVLYFQEANDRVSNYLKQQLSQAKILRGWPSHETLLASSVTS